MERRLPVEYRHVRTVVRKGFLSYNWCHMRLRCWKRMRTWAWRVWTGELSFLGFVRRIVRLGTYGKGKLDIWTNGWVCSGRNWRRKIQDDEIESIAIGMGYDG